MKAPPLSTKSDSQRKYWARQSMVYFIAAGSPPAAVKIGVSAISALRQRLGACQTGNHEPLELLGVVPFREGVMPERDAEALERELHAKFRTHQRFPEGSRGYEWFDAAPELLAYISANAEPPETLSLVRFVSRKTGPKRIRVIR